MMQKFLVENFDAVSIVFVLLNIFFDKYCMCDISIFYQENDSVLFPG